MKTYTRYKDSGISWIGKIPEHWEIDKLGHRFKQRKEKVSDKDYEPLSVSKMGVTLQLESACKSDDGDNRKLVHKGDFVVNSRSDRKGSCGFSELDGSVSLINIVITPRCDNGWYYHYLFRSNNYIEEFYRMGRGIVSDLWTTRWSEMRTIMIPVPPIEEQKSIVLYLDKKIKQITSLVAAYQKQIELLKEYKQSLIANAVTKGINPKAKMKDSGISWIGKVPEHWEIDKLGHRFIQRKEKVSDKDFEPLSVSKMGVTPQLESACKSDDGDNRKLVRKGDFVVNSRSDRKGSCGFSELDGSVSLINIVVTPRCDNGWYYHHLFRSNNYIEEFYRMGRGIVADLWTTRWSEMRTIMIPVPPIDEQKQIVAYINERVSSIDTQISSIEKQIANLNEYKQSLISDVVTGKVKV